MFRTDVRHVPDRQAGDDSGGNALERVPMGSNHLSSVMPAQ
jgi:hypothetical protein